MLFLVWDAEGISETNDTVVEDLLKAADEDSSDDEGKGRKSRKKRKRSSSASKSAKRKDSSGSDSSSEEKAGLTLWRNQCCEKGVFGTDRIPHRDAL